MSNEELQDIIGNDRLPERALLVFKYDQLGRKVYLEFASNKTWASDRKDKVKFLFNEVANYYEKFNKPKIASWLNIDGHNFNEEDYKVSWIYIDKITLNEKSCSIAFHDSFGLRRFDFENYEIQEIVSNAE